ncbi:hypothetical protein GCM10008164_00360 [Achromobacter xylosoxidans]|nr:hypothetical protein GCM10008164_00360 [Achromobacter xylosoxidans]
MLSTTALEAAFNRAAFWAAEWPSMIWTFKIGMTDSDVPKKEKPAQAAGKPSYPDLARANGRAAQVRIRVSPCQAA